ENGEPHLFDIEPEVAVVIDDEREAAEDAKFTHDAKSLLEVVGDGAAEFDADAPLDFRSEVVEIGLVAAGAEDQVFKGRRFLGVEFDADLAEAERRIHIHRPLEIDAAAEDR